ncbi:MAG: AAA family ATPase [Clostridia bacterium]|nr:AAA family ATPase [Clostridia bacterium]
MFNLLPKHIYKASESLLNSATEIRIKIGKPIMVLNGSKEHILSENGKTIFAAKDDIEEVLAFASENSLYLKEDELKRGFVSVKGGIRIGVCGSVAYKNGEIISHRDITSLNIRLPKEVIGFGDKAVKSIFSKGVLNTLIISPPGFGKTTLLKDIARQLSDNLGYRVGIVDERFEMSGFNLGIRTDVLCGCSKADGILMLIRNMAPQILVVDELGGNEDIGAVKKACQCGVSIIATIHGDDFLNIKKQFNEFCAFILLKDDYKYEIFYGDDGI